MKKKTRANMIMVAVIALMLTAAVLAAYWLMPGKENAQLGTEFEGVRLEDETAGDTCTVRIVCDTVLSHQDQLNQAKAPYVPADGIVLGKTQVAIQAGDTAFDVLQRVCQKADIQLEYSWTPIYDSYYIEGINHLYEFDCGSESGWMYQVNGQFPNYGCSSYAVKPGDDILWCYSCEDLGTDVGAKME